MSRTLTLIPLEQSEKLVKLMNVTAFSVTAPPGTRLDYQTVTGGGYLIARTTYALIIEEL